MEQSAVRQDVDLFAEETILKVEGSPWVNDQVLLNLAIWWVKSTRPETPDFSNEVAAEFSSLERDLR